MTRRDKPSKPTIEIKPNRYQPTRQELRKDNRIPATPEALARAVGQQVKVKEVKD